MTIGPEFPRPEPGDELVVVQPGNRYREEKITPVRVISVARFKIMVEGLSGERYPDGFDIRDRKAWATTAERKYNRSDVPMLYTAELLVWRDRRNAADRYLRKSGVYRMSDLRGSLKQAVEADPIGFVNVIRRFEGLEEI